MQSLTTDHCLLANNSLLCSMHFKHSLFPGKIFFFMQFPRCLKILSFSSFVQGFCWFVLLRAPAIPDDKNRKTVKYCWFHFVITITISSNVIGCLTALFLPNYSVELSSDTCNRTVGCNRTVKSANHIALIQLNWPIIKMIKVSTAKTTLSKAGKFENWRIF